MTFRKILFWLHLITGCLGGLVILIMSVTGLLLAYERQILGWMDRDLRSSPLSANSTRLPISTLLKAVAAQNPAPPTAITVHADPRAAVEVGFGRDQVFLVDPYSATVLGQSAPRTRRFFQQVENWHRWPGGSNERRPIGRAITGACNFGFLVLVVSGPFLWMPRRWSWQNVKAAALFRRSTSGRARDFNWHNVIGIWCTIPLAVIAASGLVMSYPWANNLLYRLTGSELPAAGGGPRADAAPRQPTGPGRGPRWGESTPAWLDGLWERAARQVPDWQSVTLRMPPSGRGPLAFTLDRGNGGRPDQRSQLTLDRRAEVVRWEPFSSYNTGRRLRSWLRFLHTGEAGGIAGQTVAGVASAGAAVLVWTGMCLALRRWLRWRKRPSAGALPSEASPDSEPIKIRNRTPAVASGRPAPTHPGFSRPGS